MAQGLQFHPFLCLANGGADADFRWKWGISPLLVSLIWLEPKRLRMTMMLLFLRLLLLLLMLMIFCS